MTLLAGAIALASMPVVAKDKVIPLAAADAAAMKDKTVAVSFHEPASFVATTAGKMQFGLFGAIAATKAGNDLVRDNQIADPAILIREQLAAGLRDVYGAKPQAVDTAPSKAKNGKDIAATHPQADYVLDVRSMGWSYFYYPTDWNNYWVLYSTQVQLVDKSGRVLSKAACTANSKASSSPPSRDQLHADGAKVLKDYSAALGWNCVQLLVTEQFKIPLDRFAGIPQPYAGLLAGMTPQGQKSIKAGAVAQTTPIAATSEQTVEVSAIGPMAEQVRQPASQQATEQVTRQATQQVAEQATPAMADVSVEAVAPAAPTTPAAPGLTRPTGFPTSFGGMAQPAPIKSAGDR